MGAETNSDILHFVVTVDEEKVATNYESSLVNTNDKLGSIQIYNAAALGINKDYSVTGTYKTGSTTLGTASYNEMSDRLVLDLSEAADGDTWLPNLLEL